MHYYYFCAKGRCGGGEKQLGTENGGRERKREVQWIPRGREGGDRLCLLMAAASTSNNIEVDFPPPNNN